MYNPQTEQFNRLLRLFIYNTKSEIKNLPTFFPTLEKIPEYQKYSGNILLWGLDLYNLDIFISSKQLQCLGVIAVG